MLLWLKLLAFGLALVDVGVFGQDQRKPPRDHGETSHSPTDPSFIPPRTMLSSPANTLNGNPGSKTKDTMVPTYQTSNSTEISVRKLNATSPPATTVSIAITEPLPASNSSLTTTHMDSNSSSIHPFTSTPLSPSTDMHAPSDYPNNSSMHDNTSASTATPANISQVSASTTSVPPSSSSCSIMVEKYVDAGSNVSAKLNINGASNTDNVTCYSDAMEDLKCIWNKSTNEFTGLQECERYTIKASCSKPESIHVPPVKWSLTKKDEMDTSVTLVWEINPKCNLNFSYCCQLDDGKTYCKEYSGRNATIFNLDPNTKYICTSQIYFNSTVLDNTKTDIEVQTDFGQPDKPKIISINETAHNILIYWEKLTNESNKPVDGYMVQKCHADSLSCEPAVELKASETYCNLTGLKPFTNYNVQIWAYKNSRNKNPRFEGEKSTKTIKTSSSKPSCVNNLKVILVEDNAVKITCSDPVDLNGPKKKFNLSWGNSHEISDSCEFLIKNLNHLTSYTFTVTFSNGDYSSDASSETVNTKYNAKALIGFLAFLIIVTSLALLIVLYRIYTLNRQKSRNSDEAVVLVPRDDERQLMSIEPIPAELLWETYKRNIADEGRLFLEEFQSIPRVFSKFTIKDARKSYNQNKNRYVDILPYDYNRVELSAIPSDPGSDYINASHIDGFKEPRKYIAAQGPKDETTDDFWRMIWEQKATIVVMVTRCEEGNRIKCAKYWPSMEEESATYGDILVKINDCKICPDYNIQKLHITNRREKTTGRDVTHIQFTSWPDHGVPDEAHLLLKLRRRVNALSNFFSGPIVVHCSAGVGRTGTYIGIDAMLEGLESEGRVDVYGYVVKLRRQRCLMVQVEAQYILIHQALVEYVQYGETEVSIAELHNYLNQLKKADLPSDPSLLEAEFQRLPSYKNWQSQRTGKKDENKSKNRSSTVIPYDYNRVLFKQEEEGSRESEHEGSESSDDESDCDEEPNKYINASFISGYWLQNGMIATQGPLPETIGDFWNMVYQRKVKVIVMLTELRDNTQELCEQYWGNGQVTYGSITVDLKDVDSYSSYTMRTFDVTHVKRKEPRKVYQYQYHKWKASDLPESPKDLVTIIQNLKQKLPAPDKISEAHAHSKNAQVVIHCRDGSQQTGVFCALMNLLESAETEGAIDVFQVVKALRKARPGMIPSFEDYQFLYDTIASIYPAQNGQAQKAQCQEHKIDIHNTVKKEDEANSVAIDVCPSVQESGDGLEMEEASKAKNGSREAESSLNGPMTQALTELA
ncbi:receptor-type tyrosine-protein phosphatase C isoform X2 [Anolis carolinensis]|uniref:receptor-type tyrosine-protein phosphatase C isoform X2 n=1 Tax=Anolis carolinensis TaxID=28377 RepID=UPI002F2B2154